MLTLILLLIFNYIVAIHFLYTEDSYDIYTVLFSLIPFLFVIVIIYVIFEKAYEVVKTIIDKIKKGKE